MKIYPRLNVQRVQFTGTMVYDYAADSDHHAREAVVNDDISADWHDDDPQTFEFVIIEKDDDDCSPADEISAAQQDAVQTAWALLTAMSYRTENPEAMRELCAAIAETLKRYPSVCGDDKE